MYVSAETWMQKVKEMVRAFPVRPSPSYMHLAKAFSLQNIPFKARCRIRKQVSKASSNGSLATVYCYSLAYPYINYGKSRGLLPKQAKIFIEKGELCFAIVQQCSLALHWGGWIGLQRCVEIGLFILTIESACGIVIESSPMQTYTQCVIHCWGATQLCKAMSLTFGVSEHWAQ